GKLPQQRWRDGRKRQAVRVPLIDFYLESLQGFPCLDGALYAMSVRACEHGLDRPRDCLCGARRENVASPGITPQFPDLIHQRLLPGGNRLWFARFLELRKALLGDLVQFFVLLNTVAKLFEPAGVR